MWNSPIPQQRWAGFRRKNQGAAAFQSLATFEAAQLDELESALAEHELTTLGRLLARGKKLELEVFIRTHGPNPICDPQADINIAVGVAKADLVDLTEAPSEEANQMILNGEVVHILFQAGEASRFNAGPFYRLNPVQVADELCQKEATATNGSSDEENVSISDSLKSELSALLKQIKDRKAELPSDVGSLLAEGELGLKQPILLRAAIRRIIAQEIAGDRMDARAAETHYQTALSRQKILFFVSRRGDVNVSHDENLRKKFKFYGFFPANVVTIEQELARGVTADETGRLSLLDDDEGMDASGHLYALIQAARIGDFTTYTESGRPIKPMEVDAFSYFLSRKGRVMNVIRINDMDRHSTEIINPKALAYALSRFAEGYVNVIETVANPEGQKGGTGTTFGDPEIHVLTETHENSFPALSRAFEAAMKTYMEGSGGRHPAYNAMRQWADLAATRRVLQEFGGRIVFVPRRKIINGTEMSYLGVDMPMGDLSLLHSQYKSRMFQFKIGNGRELLIHDVKKKENLPLALRAILRQLTDPYVIAAAEEICTGTFMPFTSESAAPFLYGAPASEFV